jgi:hypothetical protein
MAVGEVKALAGRQAHPGLGGKRIVLLKPFKGKFRIGKDGMAGERVVAIVVGGDDAGEALA